MDLKYINEKQEVAAFVCVIRKRAEELAEEILGSSGWDDEDIGMLIDGFYKKKFDDSDALFNEYAENWFKRMKADPKKYADFKEYNWGSIDYLIRLAIKMYGMNEACRIYGDKIREVYFDCEDGRTS